MKEPSSNAKKRKRLTKLKEKANEMDIAGFFTIKNLSTIIILAILIYLFIHLQTLLFHVFNRLSFLGSSELLFWELLLLSGFLFNVYLGYVNRYYRLIVLVFFIIMAIFGIIVLSNIIYLMEIKQLVILFLILSIMGTIFAVKYWKSSGKKQQFKGVLLIIILVSTMVVSISVLTLPRRDIEIKPKSTPELIFFTDPFNIPNDTATLEFCCQNNISFNPSYGYYSINKSVYLNKIKRAVECGVDLYINIIPYPSQYTHIGSVNNLMRVYKSFKAWLEEEGLFESKHIKAFTVDAEQPHYLGENLSKMGLYEGLNYLIKEFPTKEEINNASLTLQEFIEVVHSDNKTIGIIRSRPNLDEGDGDGDLELMNQNVYSLEVEWDFSITMLYRSQRLQETEEGSTLEFVEELFLNIYGATRTENAFVYSRYYFYLFAGIEQTPGDIMVDPEHQYIFLGNYKAEFNETTYIQDKEFFYDLDICRHFGEKKVFLYNFEGFLYSFGEDGLEELVEHNNQYKPWQLRYYAYQTEANLLLLFFLVIVDPVLGLDPRHN